MRQSGEPSVEEILDSIKKVIARDNRTGAAEQRTRRESHGVREVAQMMAAEGEDDGEVLDLAASAEYLDEAPDQDDHAAWHEPDGAAAKTAAASDPPLRGEGTRASMRDSLAALAMMAEPRAAPQIVRSGETSLEAMARELLRPALAEWLDRNLPPLVERMVAAEIARIVGKKN